MKPTKKRILQAALTLFNRQGVNKTVLQHIADEAQMSVGNLVYHYSNKTEILEAIYELLKAQQQQLLTEMHLSPIFENFEIFLDHSFQLQRQYLFFYLDLLELMRQSPALKKSYQLHIQSQEAQFEIFLQMNQARGACSWLDEPDLIDTAVALRRTMDSWFYLRLTEGKAVDDPAAYRSAMWFVLRPFFTDSGREEFRDLLSLSEIRGA